MNDDFEQRLQHQPLRPLPARWRTGILAAARTERPRPSTLGARPTPWWRELLWPSPWAWAGAAAAWVLIFTLNFAASTNSEGVLIARSPALPASVVEQALAEQRLLLTSLLDLAPSELAAPPREPIRLRPRSERKTEWFCA